LRWRIKLYLIERKLIYEPNCIQMLRNLVARESGFRKVVPGDSCYNLWRGEIYFEISTYRIHLALMFLTWRFKVNF